MMTFSLLSVKAQKLTPKLVYDYCLEIGIIHPEIVTAQSILETGWYKCTNCCMDYNNIFGFTYKGSFKEYSDWKESAQKYKEWQLKYYNPLRDYYEFLACLYNNGNGGCTSYSEHPEEYNKDLRWIVKKIKPDLNLQE